MSGDFVKLNVGGHLYTTSLLVLRRCPASMLSTMFSGKFDVSTDDNGYHLIDRDGTLFAHILRYLRDDQFPPEDVAIQIYKEAQYFGLLELMRLLEHRSSKVIANLRRKRFREMVVSEDDDWELLSSNSKLSQEERGRESSYDRFLNVIIRLASEQLHSFEKSYIVITNENIPRLMGTIACYNCNRELVDVGHTCLFEGFSSCILLRSKDSRNGNNGDQSAENSLTCQQKVKFVVNDLKHHGFTVDCREVVCSFSKRCEGCVTSGLYTAGGILAPKECPNVGYMISFTW